MAQKQSPNRTAKAQEEVMVDADDSAIGQAFTVSMIVILSAVVLVGGAILIWKFAWQEDVVLRNPAVTAAKSREVGEIELPTIGFRNITDESGVSFVHENGAAGLKLLPETMGGGVAFFDYDNDGDLDLLLVNSNHWPEDATDDPAPRSKLYANDGSGQFTDVTEEAGFHLECYGMGVAIGDYNNDGWRDVFVTAVGENRLFRNNQGTFEDVTTEASVAGEQNEWSTSAGFFDFDNDGDLDLFVCNYIQWSRDIDLRLGSTLDGINRAYGPPTQFSGAYPYLYRNEGNGKFVDVSAESGVQVANPNTGVPMAKSLGMTIVDCNADGFLDVAVSNDTVQNMLFLNQAGERFEDVGLLMGMGVDKTGRARGAMGIDASYFRNNQSLGIAIGNFANEPTSLYVASKPGATFSDEENSTGVGPVTRMELTFGLFFIDFDLDGRDDLFAANGHLEDDIQKIQSKMRFEQPPHLMWNAGPKSSDEFITLAEEFVGKDFVEPMVGRGAAYADIDGDGDQDLIITSIGRPPRLLRNEQNAGNHFLRVHVGGRNNTPDGIGAAVTVHFGDQTKTRRVSLTKSYLSQCEPVVTFGLGDIDAIDKVVVRWPDGMVAEETDVPLDKQIEIAYPN